MSNFVLEFPQHGRRITVSALLAIVCAGCSANALRVTEPAYTGSTANQRAIIAGQTAAPDAPINLGPVNNQVQAQSLPPAEPYQQPAQAAAAPYTPPKPYAASGMSAPVGKLSSQPTQPAGSLNQQAAVIAAKPAKKNAGPGGNYVVRSGDTVWAISQRHQVNSADLIAANNISGNNIKIGQSLMIPGASSAKPVAVAKAAPATAKKSPPPSEPIHLASVPKPRTDAPTRIATIKPTGDAEPVRYTAPKAEPGSVASSAGARSDAAPDTAKAGDGFRWPVRGRIISDYGKKTNGERNDGINLAVPEGTSVKAAEDGTVIYAGSELKSYGNLVLVKHDNGYVTAYGHNRELLVKRGDTVRRGQILAESGMSGGVNTPQLHFELRKGANPVNPLDYMSDA